MSIVKDIPLKVLYRMRHNKNKKETKRENKRETPMDFMLPLKKGMKRKK